MLLSNHKPNKIFRHGVTLIELIIVLGISSIIVAGSTAWFESQKSVTFVNEVRQLESEVRLAQSQINTNELPGFGSGCQTAARTGCPIGQNQQVFSSLVRMNTTPGNERVLTIDYLSATTNPTTKQVLANGISTYSSRNITLDAGVQYIGSRTLSGVCASSYDGWTRRNLMGAGGITTGADGIAFRHDPNVMNHFGGSGSSVYQDWGGDNPTSTLNAGGSIATMPCAVMWQFESVERLNGSSEPRFSAELVFDIRNKSIKLQTR